MSTHKKCPTCTLADLQEISHICGNGMKKMSKQACPICQADEFEEMRRDMVVWLQSLEARILKLEGGI